MEGQESQTTQEEQHTSACRTG